MAWTTSGGINVPLRRVKVPVALITVRTPNFA